ncbi:MAG: SOS response-associated peptidase family protein, partial [Gemmatimonadota bacterium]
MCGRYTLTVDQEALQVALGVEGLVHPRPRFNVAPSQTMPAVVVGEGPV